MSVKMIKVMLLDDHIMIRQSLSNYLLLEDNIEIVGSYGESRDLFFAIKTKTCDVLVLDYSLSPDDVDGLNLIRAIRTRYPSIHILIVSSHYNLATIALTFRAGVRGFIGKQQNLEALVKAINIVMSGNLYLTEEMAQNLMLAQDLPIVRTGLSSGFSLGEVSKMVNLSILSPREQEVIRCFMQGMSVSEIANKFSRSIKTISGQKQVAIKKLGLKSDRELFIIKNELLNEQ